MVDQSLHRLIDASPGRWRDLAVIHPVVTFGHRVHDLFHDLERLPDLLDADPVAVVDVTSGAHRDLELVEVDPGVREGFAEVPPHPGGAQGGAGDRLGYGLFGRYDAYPLGSGDPDRVLSQQVVVLVDPARQVVEDGGDIVLPSRSQIRSHAAGPNEVVVHAEPGVLLEEGEDRLALPEPIDHHRQSTYVHPIGGQRDQM
jgi:hypothetical protein